MSIEIKHLNHIYGQGTIFEQYALKDVNLTIHDGEFIGLIGHTGSGKSTLTQPYPEPASARTQTSHRNAPTLEGTKPPDQ